MSCGKHKYRVGDKVYALKYVSLKEAAPAVILALVGRHGYVLQFDPPSSHYIVGQVRHERHIFGLVA